MQKEVVQQTMMRSYHSTLYKNTFSTLWKGFNKRKEQLPACVDRKTIRLIVDYLADGAWGTLSGLVCIVYLIQRYQFRGQARTSIFLYGSPSGMNSLTKLTHQFDAELAAIHLAVKETNKCVTSLKDLNIKPEEGGPRLISDSQTCLALCSRPSSTLDLSTSLVVSRVQETSGYKNLFYLSGSYFSTNIDLLTRYDVKILSKISQDFFQPPFLMPELMDRVTVKVENMRTTVDLPNMCERQKIWTQMKKSSLPGNLLEKPATTTKYSKGYHLTGRWVAPNVWPLFMTDGFFDGWTD